MKSSRKKRHDCNEIAARIAAKATGEPVPTGIYTALVLRRKLKVLKGGLK